MLETDLRRHEFEIQESLQKAHRVVDRIHNLPLDQQNYIAGLNLPWTLNGYSDLALIKAALSNAVTEVPAPMFEAFSLGRPVPPDVVVWRGYSSHTRRLHIELLTPLPPEIVDKSRLFALLSQVTVFEDMVDTPNLAGSRRTSEVATVVTLERGKYLKLGTNIMLPSSLGELRLSLGQATQALAITTNQRIY